MKKVLVIIVIIAVLGVGVVLVKNNSSNSSSSTTTTTPTPASSSSQSSTSSTPQATDKVTIKDFAFSPAAITVKKGTTVTWTNQDSAAHTVTETDGKTGPNSENLENGMTYSFKFDTVGTFKYHCAIHSDMTGTVTVTE